MRTNAWACLGWVLALATSAEAREEVIFFQKERKERWAINADGSNERRLHTERVVNGYFRLDEAGNVFEEWAAGGHMHRMTRQEPPAGMLVGQWGTYWYGPDGREVHGTAFVILKNGPTGLEHEVISPYYTEPAPRGDALAADGQRVVFSLREGDVYKIYLRDASGAISYLTTAKHHEVGFGWLTGGPAVESALIVERLPAEMSVRGNYGSFFSSDRDREVSQLLLEQIQEDEAPPSILVEGIGRLPVARMTANELRALYTGLQDAGSLMAWSPLKYSIFTNFGKKACVVAADKRSEVLSAELGEDWTVTSIGWTGVGIGHHYSVATYWGEDGTAYHFSMDNYLVVPSIKYLGSSGEEFPGATWFSLDQERTEGNAFFRAGEKLTTLDGVPVEASRFDLAALERARQADARLREFTWREVTANPPRAMRFGRTYLPFQLTVVGRHTQEPLANATVELRVAGGSAGGLMLEMGQPGARTPPGEQVLMLVTDGAGQLPLIYLCVDDAFRVSRADAAVLATVQGDGGAHEVITWEVLDNLEELETRFRAAFPAGQGSSVHEGVAAGHGHLERVAFMSDVVLRGLGDDGSGYTIDRVLGFLTSILSDEESAHLLNGLLYHPVWVHNRGALHFATAVYCDSTGFPSEHARVFDAGATRSPVSYEADDWAERFGGPDQELALESLGDGPADAPPALTALVSCPVEVLFTDADGRRVGFADGAYVNELRAPLGHTRQDLPEADGTHAKLVTYADAKGTLTIVGQGDGTFSLDLVHHQADGSALWVEFVDVPIMAGEAVTFPVDAASPDLPGERSGGGVVFASGPATRINPPPPPGARRGGAGCTMTGAGAATPGFPGAATLLLLALLGCARRAA